MARPLGPVVKEVGPEGAVLAPALGRILGITGSEVEKFTATLSGDNGAWIPSTVRPTGMAPPHDEVHWYDVDLVMKTAMHRPTRLTLLRVAKANWVKEELWAAEALARGPWNCPRAPSSRGWWLYLDGKNDAQLRRRLSATAHNWTVRAMAKEERIEGVSAGQPRKDRENPPPIVEAPVGVAEGVFKSLSGDGMGGRIDAPFAREGGDGGLEEAEWPPPVREEAGY